MLWVMTALLLLILIDVVRLHRKIDHFMEMFSPDKKPTDEEIEQQLESENINNNYEK